MEFVKFGGPNGFSLPKTQAEKAGGEAPPFPVGFGAGRGYLDPPKNCDFHVRGEIYPIDLPDYPLIHTNLSGWCWAGQGPFGRPTSTSSESGGETRGAGYPMLPNSAPGPEIAGGPNLMLSRFEYVRNPARKPDF